MKKTKVNPLEKDLNKMQYMVIVVICLAVMAVMLIEKF